MGKLIDAEALKKEIGRAPVWTALSVKELIDEQVDIVRCKECKWADWYKTADGEQFCYCIETGNGGRTADDYCSYAERSKQ